jgi:hypothetical protein
MTCGGIGNVRFAFIGAKSGGGDWSEEVNGGWCVRLQ